MHHKKAIAATARNSAAATAGGDLGGPDRGGGQGALQGTTNQAVSEPLTGGPTDSPSPSGPAKVSLPLLSLSPLNQDILSEIQAVALCTEW